MKTHYLKTWLIYFDRIKTGQKKFEIRKNDRDFQAGDKVVLQGFDPEHNEYSGGEIEANIGYVYNGEIGLQEGFICFQLVGAYHNSKKLF